MKKFFFALTVVLLLLGSVAFAGPACEKCGNPNTSKSGSGAWCHWYCSECGYTTSRNHDPHSYKTGLVPASCSGRCRWCGAAAVASSHKYGPWVSNGDATCTRDGTQTSRCNNPQCRVSKTQADPGSALGHDYKVNHIPATCERSGATRHTCSRCGHRFNSQVFEALGHEIGPWVCNGDGTHTARCLHEGCTVAESDPCIPVTQVIAGREVTLCSVCGSGSASGLAVSSHAQALLDFSELPGDLVVLVDAAPLEIPVSDEAFYMFVTSLVARGECVPFSGRLDIRVDLNAHPFQMEDSIFSGRTPAELNGRAFRIVQVDTVHQGGETVEIWRDVPYTFKKGVLTFEAEEMGVFLMVLPYAEPQGTF